MNSKFFDISKEKQDRMINAALKIFAMHGYRHASTDDIVREACISKGLLFHYFGSKLGVYQFMYDYSVRYMTLELKSCVDEKGTDFFEMRKQIELARLHAMRGYPYMQQFLYRSEKEDVSEVLLSTENRRNSYEALYEEMENRIDYSAFSSEEEGRKLRNMMEYTIRGLLEEKFEQSSFQPDMLYDEVCEYIDLMKRLVGTKVSEKSE